MSKVGDSEEVLKQGLISKERIFPILNKLDRIWTKNNELQLMNLLDELMPKNPMNDLELTQYLDAYIDKHKIK